MQHKHCHLSLTLKVRDQCMLAAFSRIPQEDTLQVVRSHDGSRGAVHLEKGGVGEHKGVHAVGACQIPQVVERLTDLGHLRSQ